MEISLKAFCTKHTGVSAGLHAQEVVLSPVHWYIILLNKLSTSALELNGKVYAVPGARQPPRVGFLQDDTGSFPRL